MNYKTFRDYFRKTTKSEEKTLRISGAGIHVGLSVMIDVESKHYLSSTRPFPGAEILIHDSQDFPTKSDVSTIAQPGQDVNLVITPSVMVSTPDIKNLALNLRQCWFSDEMKLRNTKKYSFSSW